MAYQSTNAITPEKVKQGSLGGVNLLNGVYVGTVIANDDSIYTGRIKVHFPEFGAKSAPYHVLLVTPFGGYTSPKDSSGDPTQYGTDDSSEQGAPKSYGMWPQPPAIGTEVICAFTARHNVGYLLGSAIGIDRNHMMGGKASALNYAQQNSILPVSEKNPYDQNDPDTKPADPATSQNLIDQGLENDYVRGHSQSSARRESPSRVFGLTTADGHVITMDDGDSQGNSKNIRLRTKGGAQVLLDDTTQIVFITNQKGNAYIEMDADGRIDVYSQKDISYHAEGDFNLHAKGNINMQADNGVQIKSIGADGIKVEATAGDYDLFTGKDFKFEAGANGNLIAAGNYKEQASRIDMNGPAPASATKIDMNQLVENTNILESASTRVPEHHPWKGATGVQESFNVAKGNTN